MDDGVLCATQSAVHSFYFFISINKKTQCAMETHSVVNAENWNADDVAEWLKEIGLSEHAESFQNSKITGNIPPSVEDL